MKNRILKTFFAIVLSINMIILSTHNTYAAKESVEKMQIIQYGLKNPIIGAIDAKVWVSDLDKNFTNTKIVFDARSFSDIYTIEGEEYYITDHWNALIIDASSFDGKLSVASSGVGMEIGEKNSTVCTLKTIPTSNKHQAIYSNNNTLKSGMFGTVSGVLGFPFNMINHGIIDVTSKQQVYINGTQYNNLAEVRVYY